MLYNLTQIASCLKTRREIISVLIFLTFAEFNMQELYRNFQNMYSRVPLEWKVVGDLPRYMSIIGAFCNFEIDRVVCIRSINVESAYNYNRSSRVRYFLYILLSI